MSEDGYRFGFNGKENDWDFGMGLIQDYGFRLYNPSIGKFLSIDPLTRSYPFLTSYQFASNTPIYAIDLDGLEMHSYVLKQIEENGKTKLKIIHKHTSDDFLTNLGGEHWYIQGINHKNNDPQLLHFATQEEFEIVKSIIESGDMTFEQFKEIQDYEAVKQILELAAEDIVDLQGAKTINIGSKETKRLTAPARKSARVAKLPSQLQRRVKLRADVKNTIMERARVVKDKNGNMRWVDDTTGKPIPGNRRIYDPSRDAYVYGDFHFGHKDGKDWKTYQNDSKNWGKTRDQIREEQNNPDIYQIEYRKPNESKGGRNAHE